MKQGYHLSLCLNFWGHFYVRTEICSLPHGIEKKLKALQKQLGIAFGCVDFAIDKSENPYFLEVNQGGQFLFMEKYQNKLPLLRAFCAMLMEGKVNYSLNTCEPISFEEFIKSEYHSRWYEKVKKAKPQYDEHYSADAI